MQLKNILPVALATAASAQNITEALLSQNSTLSSLIGLLGTQPALVTALGGLSNITVLAPSNDALSKFLNSSAGSAAASMPDAVTALLMYHVLNGTYPASAFTNTSQFIPTLLTNSSYTNVTGGQVVDAKLNGSSVEIFTGLKEKSTVTTANVNFTGGVIHIIDTVLTVPESDSATAVGAGLTSLAGALTSAKLVTALDGLKDVTIFAPSNAAFQAIGSATGTLSTAALTSILTYHVINGTIGYSTALSNTTIPTLNGGSVTITIEDGDVFVNSARVIIPDVLVANGVVHVIDNVLNPNNTAVSVEPTNTAPATPAFSGASSASDVPFTSGISAATTASGVMPTSSGSGSPSSTASAGGAAQAIQTGVVGAAALFGAGAVLLNM